MSTNNYISFKKITLASGQTIQNWLDDFYYPNIASMPTYARFTFYDASGAIVGEYINDKIVINGVNEAELLTKEDKVNKVTTLAGANNTTYPTTLLMSTELGKKQNTLVSGTNIKTIQGQSVLGSDNIEISFSNIAGNLSIATATGSGNAITGLTASGSTITPAKGSVGTVTSVSGTGSVSGLTLSGTVTGSGSLSLGGSLSLTGSEFGSKTAKYFLAAPNGSNGIPTFRAIVASDIPTLNQNTTGSAGSLSTARTLTIGGTDKSFDGSANVTWSLAELGVITSWGASPTNSTFPSSKLVKDTIDALVMGTVTTIDGGTI